MLTQTKEGDLRLLKVFKFGLVKRPLDWRLIETDRDTEGENDFSGYEPRVKN